MLCASICSSCSHYRYLGLFFSARCVPLLRNGFRELTPRRSCSDHYHDPDNTPTTWFILWHGPEAPLWLWMRQRIPCPFTTTPLSHLAATICMGHTVRFPTMCLIISVGDVAFTPVLQFAPTSLASIYWSARLLVCSYTFVEHRQILFL